MDINENSKRIFKNTVVLYLRMALVMIVSLYSSRVILKTLGLGDFGIYNVVGGIVVMFTFLSSAIGQSTQRFISFELGKGNIEKLRQIFSMIMNAHIIVVIIIVILSESVGVWFLNTQLNIPPNRIEAANWVYQFSVLSVIISVTQIPYNAAIYAHEEMQIYAWVSVIEVLLKLFIIFLLKLTNYDKLVLYAFLIFLITTLVAYIYRVYCIRNFSECRYKFHWDKEIFKNIFNYTSWSLFGNIAGVATSQGVNIILNIFFGPAVNSARAIAFQVKSAIASFVYNFQGAAIPQIVKSYASNEQDYMIYLTLKSSRISFLLLFMLAFPFLIETEYIINLWLENPPQEAIFFCRLVIINTLIDCLGGTLQSSIQATGKIKLYQLSVGIIQLLNLPLSYVFLKNGFSADVTMIISCILSAISVIMQMYVVEKLIDLKVNLYIKTVILKSLYIVVLNVFASVILIKDNASDLYSFIYQIVIITVINGIVIFLIGFDKSEKKWIYNILKSLSSKKIQLQ